MRIMKSVALLALVCPMVAFALPDWNVRYYAGRLNILDKKTGAKYVEDVVMYHLVDADTDLISQVACVKDTGTPAYLVTTYMMRNGDDSLNVSERSDLGEGSKLSGEGQALGQKYYWDRFTLTMRYARSQKSNDYVTMRANLRFVTGGLKVSKRVWFANGQPKQDWSGFMPQIAKGEFLRIASAMKCPLIP